MWNALFKASVEDRPHDPCALAHSHIAPLTVVAAGRAEMDLQLDEAVSTVKTLAMQDKRHGILVSRLGDNVFTVALSDLVPYGQTEERQEWGC